MPQPPKNPRLNNKVRQSQGLNTGATVNLGETIAQNRQIPPTSNIAGEQSIKGGVNQAATENWGALQAQKINSDFDLNQVLANQVVDHSVIVNGRPLTREEIYQNYYGKNYQEFELPNAARRYAGIPTKDYDGQNVLSYKNFIEAGLNAPLQTYQVQDELPSLSDGVGYPEVKTFWGQIGKRNGYYTQADKKNPEYNPTVRGWFESNPADVMQSMPGGSWVNSQGTRIISGKIGLRYPPIENPWDLVFHEYLPAKTSSLLTERQSLAGIESLQRQGMMLGNGGEPIDIKMGGIDLAGGQGWVVRPQNQNKALGEVFNSEPVQMLGFDVERGVKGVSDQRLAPPLGRLVESDKYPMAPQWARENRDAPLEIKNAVADILNSTQYEDLPGYERAINNPVWFSNYIANKSRSLPSYPQTPLSVPLEHRRYYVKQSSENWYNRSALGEGLPILIGNEERVQAARRKDTNAYNKYLKEQLDLVQQRSGSFNMIVAPEGHRERVIAEGLMPDVPNAPVEGLYLNGKPWMPGVNKSGELSKLELPRNLAVEVPGMGQFPLAGGVSTDISFGKLVPDKLIDGVAQMKEGKELALRNVVRDRWERWGMDAQDALNDKRAIADRAKAKYHAISASPTATVIEKSVALNEMNRHEAEYTMGVQNLQRAYSYEPQPNVQPVKVALTIPHDDSSSIDLLRSHGMEINSSDLTPNGMVITASGNLPLDVQMQLNAQLASRFNREELVLPPNVSIASSAKAFENAGISSNALVKGVQWGKNERGDETIVNPGKVVGYWKGQRVVQGNVDQPTVRQLATAPTTQVESDPEWQQLIAARDEAKQQRVDNLIQTVNLKRAERGEPLLGVGSNGQLFHLPQDNISVVSGEDIDNIVFSAAAAKRQPLNDKANTVLNQALHNAAVRESARNKQLAIGNQIVPKAIRPTKQPTGTQAFRDDWEIAQSDVHPLDALAANNQQQTVEPRVIVRPTNEVLDNTLSIRPVFTASPNLGSNRFDLSAINNEISPVIRPATVDLNSNSTNSSLPRLAPAQEPVISPTIVDLNQVPPPSRTVRFEPVPGGFQSYIEHPVKGTVPHKFVTHAELDEAVATSQNKGWTTVAPDRVIDITATPISDSQYFRTDIPIEGDDTTWTYTPRPRPQSQNGVSPTPVIVQDPANTWNRYIPAATAIAGLGLGAGTVYALSDHDNSEEEQLRQQLMQQQMYLQQIRMGRR